MKKREKEKNDFLAFSPSVHDLCSFGKEMLLCGY